MNASVTATGAVSAAFSVSAAFAGYTQEPMLFALCSLLAVVAYVVTALGALRGEARVPYSDHWSVG